MLKVNFSVLVIRPTVRVTEFSVIRLGIPLLICETKQGYRTGEERQLRLDLPGVHTHTYTINIIAYCVCVCV